MSTCILRIIGPRDNRFERYGHYHRVTRKRLTLPESRIARVLMREKFAIFVGYQCIACIEAITISTTTEYSMVPYYNLLIR